MTRRNWYTHDFLAESQKLLEKAPTSKDTVLTPPAEGLSNISKYPRHLPDFACCDGNSRNQSLVGVVGACVNKTLPMAPEEEVWASVPANLPEHPAQSIALDMLYPMHFAHLR
ncbi:uncharacterized protein TNCV_1147861 [Trichonephila clavipes]|nr:uncharacterized protein TNCV_1147861 [Trichonephila clavipes]